MSARAHRKVHPREPVANKSLIRFVRQRPCLYDKTDPNYKDQLKRDNAWLDICRLSLESWDMLSLKERSDKLAILQTRWRGLRDCFKRYLRKLQEARSGSGSKRVVPYVHAKELVFLRPFMELRETQSSWEEREEGQEACQEAACAEAGGLRSLEQSVEESKAVQESNVGKAASQIEQTAEPIRLRSQRRSRSIGGRHGQNMKRFADLVKRMNQKPDDLQSEDHGFGIMVAGMLKNIPQGRKNTVKKAVMDLLEASMHDQPATASSPMFFPPPPSGPYYNYPNPPPPRTHPYYPPCFPPY